MKPSRFLAKHFPKKDVLVLLLLCILYCGCGTSYIVTPTQGEGDYSYNDLASEFDKKEAYITLKGSSEILGSQIRANADSLYWTEPESSKHYAVAVQEVQRISRTNHVIGAFQGLGFGVLGAVTVFAANARAGADDPSFGVKIIGTLTLPPLGLILGAIVGHSYEYSFPVDSTSAKEK